MLIEVPNQTEHPIKSQGRIPSLDGLRGVAIIMVLFGHAAATMPTYFSPAFLFIGNSSLGVRIFFMLSGFLIYQLSTREIDRSGSFSWKQFYIRRVLRIFPCFYFYIILIVILREVGFVDLSSRTIASAATFTLNYRHLWDNLPLGLDYDTLGHYWTLALEEQFYLTWPILMMLFLRKRLFVLLAVIVATAPFIRIASYYLMPASRGQIAMMFHSGFDSIASGVLLGELLRDRNGGAWLVRQAASPLKLGVALVMLAVISPMLHHEFRGAYAITVGITLDNVCLGLLFTAAISQEKSSLFRFLNGSFISRVGVLSYSLYVWNNLFLLKKTDYWFLSKFPCNLICVIIMGLFSYYIIERPFLKLKERVHQSGRGEKLPVGH